MNTTTDSTAARAARQRRTRRPVARSAGTAAWEDAVRLQRWATADHADFYALAGEMVATLYALDDLAQVLGRQVAGYADTQRARGRASTTTPARSTRRSGWPTRSRRWATAETPCGGDPGRRTSSGRRSGTSAPRTTTRTRSPGTDRAARIATPSPSGGGEVSS